jgi:hypothetical protein
VLVLYLAQLSHLCHVAAALDDQVVYLVLYLEFHAC